MKRKTNFAPSLLSKEDVGDRWGCNKVTAGRRLDRLGIKANRLTKRSVLYRLEDIVRVEEECG